MEKPGVGLGVILLKCNKEVLLGKRKNSHGTGTWSFPGGHIELFESFEDCAYREVKEETGLGENDFILIDKTPIAVTNDFFPAEKKHYVTLYLRGKYHSSKKPERIEKDKCEEWKWYQWKSLPSNLFVPVKNLIKQGYSPFL